MERALVDTIRFSVELTYEELSCLPPPTKWSQYGQDDEIFGSCGRYEVRININANWPSWEHNINCSLLGEKYFVIEYSAHKAINGVNGWPISPKHRTLGLWILRPLVYVRNFFGFRFGADRVKIQRVDLGILYNFPDQALFWGACHRAYFPRRDLIVNKTSLHTAPSKYAETYIKFYAKQPEQMVKNHLKCPPWINKDEYLQSIANYVRFEIGFRKPFFKRHNVIYLSDFNSRIFVKMVQKMRKSLFQFIGVVKPDKKSADDVREMFYRYPKLAKFREEYLRFGHDVMRTMWIIEGKESQFYRHLRNAKQVGFPLSEIPAEAKILQNCDRWELMPVV